MHQERLSIFTTRHIDLMQEVITTLPVTPARSEIIFTAAGIVSPGYKEENGAKRYILECQEMGIIPYTRVGIKYNEAGKFFTPDYSNRLVDIVEKTSDEIRERAFANLFNGGKIHKIRVEAGNMYNYQNFKKSLFPLLVGQGYHIAYADLWLSTHHENGYNEGTYRDSGIDFNILLNGQGRMFLDTWSELPEGEELNTRKWFGDLKQKYSEPIRILGE